MCALHGLLADIETNAIEAKALIDQGKIKRAKSIISRLRHSPFDEAYEHYHRLSAYLFAKKGQFEESKKIALQGLNYAWGDHNLLHLLRIANPAITPTTALFEITIRAGVPSLGPVGMFTKKFGVNFVVLADERDEALRYISDIGQIEAGHTPRVISSKINKSLPEEADNKGVYWISSFERLKKY